MNKSETRLKLIRYKDMLKELRALYVFNEEERDRKYRDLEILKQKIQLLERELNDDRTMERDRTR